MRGASRGRNLTDDQVLYAMNIDDAYCVEQVLSRNAGCLTELVTLDGAGPFVRKKIPHSQVRRGVWTSLSECRCSFLPMVQTTYELPDHFVIVHDYVAGESLADYVASKGRLSAEEATALVLNVCEAVAQLHARRIVHCDLTPANIIVSDDGAHVIDFGNARLEGEDVSREQARQGVVGFAAPEQYGFANVDSRSDIYSIGSLLGFMLTGVMPSDNTFDRALEDESVVSSYFRQVIEVARSFAPSDRFKTARALGRALGGAEFAADDGADSRDANASHDAPDPQSRVDIGQSRASASREGQSASKWSSAARWAVLIAAIVVTALALRMATCSFFGSSNQPEGKEYEQLNWSEEGLDQVLPNPPHDEGEIDVYDDSISVTVAHCTKEDFDRYADDCREKGFNIDPEQSTSDIYKAYSSEGYHVFLLYLELNDEISIDLSYPIGTAAIDWPDTGPATLIPMPSSVKGRVEIDNSEHFFARLTDMTLDDFRQYIEECRGVGFVEEYSKGDTYYRAYDKEGNYVKLEYVGFNTISLSVSTLEYNIEYGTPPEWADTSSDDATEGSSDEDDSSLLGQLLGSL